jgi:hypothetical protein
MLFCRSLSIMNNMEFYNWPAEDSQIFASDLLVLNLSGAEDYLDSILWDDFTGDVNTP